jgi:hypothetical protein
MSRLIVSGCSYTFYLQPTWPMFLSKKFDETYSFGCGGAGNDYIFNSIIDADSILKFNQDDTVIIEWSGDNRLDHFIKDGESVRWVTQGDLAHRPIDEFTMLNSYFPEDGLKRKTVNYMVAVYRYLKEKKVNFIFTSLYDLRSKKYSYLLDEMYEDCFVLPGGMTEYYLENFVRTGKHTQEWGHPDFMAHYEFAKEFANKLKIELDPEPNLSSLLDLVGSEEDYHKFIHRVDSHPLYRFAIQEVHSPLSDPNSFRNKLTPHSWTLYQKILQDVLGK